VGSLTALRDKNQRTVYRLTLVAGWNASDAAEYAKLIDLGKPDLIEIKGMTYCGATSGASNLTMKNVPYHDDVKKFGEALCTARINLVSGRDAEKDAAEDEPLTGGTPRSAEYGLACEHAHSCCILLARKDPYLVDGKWHTWIDYEKFQELVARASRSRATSTCSPRRTGPCGARRRGASTRARRACAKCATTRGRKRKRKPRRDGI
jgi:tRNA wybutosine-synthesizing protein 1